MKEEKRRASKFRNVFGKGAVRKAETYEGFRVSKHQTESCPLAVNPKWMAVSIQSEGGGSFVTVPIWQKGRIDQPRLTPFTGHAKPVSELAWNPFDDDVLATGSDDSTVKIWSTTIQPGPSLDSQGEAGSGGKDPLLLTLRRHERRISSVAWHPSACNILATGSCDSKAIVWNVETGQAVRTILDHEDSVWNVCWNYDGSLLGTTCKDKSLRIIDPRAVRVVGEVRSHQGVKGSKAFFVDRDPDGRHQSYMISTGFSRMSERQIAVWDQRNFKEPLSLEIIDSAPGALFPFFDQDTGMLYVGGKGDGNIRFYEFRVDPDTPTHLSHLGVYQTSIPQTGLCCMPKRGLDTSICEVFRFYKLRSSGSAANGVPVIEPVSMIVPRKSDLYQDDLYPPTAGPRPALQAQEWISGKNCNPLLVSMKNFAGTFTQEPPPKPGQRPLSQLSVLKSKYILRGETHEPVEAGSQTRGIGSSTTPTHRIRADESSATDPGPAIKNGAGAKKKMLEAERLLTRFGGGTDDKVIRTKSVSDVSPPPRSLNWLTRDDTSDGTTLSLKSHLPRLTEGRERVAPLLASPTKESRFSEFGEYLSHVQNYDIKANRDREATANGKPPTIATQKLQPGITPVTALSLAGVRQGTTPSVVATAEERGLAKAMRGVIVDRRPPPKGGSITSSTPSTSTGGSSPALSDHLDNLGTDITKVANGHYQDNEPGLDGQLPEAASVCYAETVAMCNEMREENRNYRMEINYKNRRIVELENQVAESGRRIKELEMELGLDKLYATLRRQPKRGATVSIIPKKGSNPESDNFFTEFRGHQAQQNQQSDNGADKTAQRLAAFRASLARAHSPQHNGNNHSNEREPTSSHRFVIPPLRKSYSQIK